MADAHRDPCGVASKDRDLVSARPEPPDQPGAAKMIADQVAAAKKAEKPAPDDSSAPNPHDKANKSK